MPEHAYFSDKMRAITARKGRETVAGAPPTSMRSYLKRIRKYNKKLPDRHGAGANYGK